MSLVSSALVAVCTRLGWAHLSTRPGRTLLTIIGVGLGVAATIAVQTANVDVLRSFEESVLSVAGPVTLEVSAGESGMDERLIADVRTVEGVESARPVVEVGVRVAEEAGRTHSFLILGVDVLEELNSMRDRIPATLDAFNNSGKGDGLEGLLTPNGILLGQALASDMGVGAGKELVLQAGGHEVSVSILAVMDRRAGPPSIWDRLAVMDIAAAQRTFGLSGRLDRIDIVTRTSAPVEQVAEAIQQVLPPAVTVRRPIQRSRQVESMVGAFQLNLSVLSMVGLLVGIFLIYNTVSFTVTQRRREVGILRAIGMSESMVVGLFLAEAGLFGLAGGLFGGGLGLMLGNVLVGLVGRTVQDLYVPLTDLPKTFGFPPGSGRMFLEAVVIGSGVSMLGALGPSLDAGRTIIVAALAPGEYDVAQQVRAASLGIAGWFLLVIALGAVFAGPVGGVPVFGYVATFCVLAGLSCLVPILMQQFCRTRELGTSVRAPSLGGTIRHIAREQTTRGIGRNAVTVSAFLVGVAIMVGVMVMIRSFRDTVEIWIDQTVMADFIVAPTGWPHAVQSGTLNNSLPSAWRTKLDGTAGVSAVDAYRDVRIELQGRPVSLVSRDLALHAARSRYLFVEGESAAILARAAAGEGTILSEVLADHLQVTSGSRLSVMTPAGEQSLVVLGVFFDYATDGGKLVIDRSLYRQWWGDEGVTVFPVYIVPGADLEQVRINILRTLAQDSQGDLLPTLLSNAELRQEILRIFDRTFTLTYVLEAIAVIIAMLGIINTLVTSVVERRRELATLQALGSSRGQITALILWEAGYLGLLGTVMGLLGGLALAWILIRVINRQSFGWTIQVSWPLGLMAEVGALALIASLLAGFWPARWAARQPLVEGLRYE
ncbi:MAG: AttF component of AttEFGH ABC transport system / AttG component of AttEFGH ABC transport system [Nitrospira sp.]|jgi:putative ABC transport system permease protein|nr:MAG: AttF component of AttEFGH ABC transport system / AttG component of AttEFGH ABC transport system [Nitrospira sp.]